MNDGIKSAGGRSAIEQRLDVVDLTRGQNHTFSFLHVGSSRYCCRDQGDAVLLPPFNAIFDAILDGAHEPVELRHDVLDLV